MTFFRLINRAALCSLISISAACAPVAENTSIAGSTTPTASEPTRTISAQKPAKTPQRAKTKAQKEAELFAACLWDRSPQTTANWSETEKSFSTFPMDQNYSAEQLMVAHMMTACGEVAYDTVIPVYAYTWLVSAIEAARPAELGVDSQNYRTAKCTYFLVKPDGSLHTSGAAVIGQRNGKYRRQHSFGVPVPTELVGAEERDKCEWVASDGSLSDA